MGGFLIKMTYRITQPCLPERQTGTEQKKNYIQANNLHSNLNGLDNFTTILLLLMMRFNQDDSHFIHDCLKFLQSGHLKSPKNTNCSGVRLFPACHIFKQSDLSVVWMKNVILFIYNLQMHYSRSSCTTPKLLSRNFIFDWINHNHHHWNAANILCQMLKHWTISKEFWHNSHLISLPITVTIYSLCTLMHYSPSMKGIQ